MKLKLKQDAHRYANLFFVTPYAEDSPKPLMYNALFDAYLAGARAMNAACENVADELHLYSTLDGTKVEHLYSDSVQRVIKALLTEEVK